MMWLIITVAVCFMLSCVMLISSGGGIRKRKMPFRTPSSRKTDLSVRDKA
ncbi:MAG: hypothetical protein ACLUFV_07760 [Acutalibacteraceae bacterium]